MKSLTESINESLKPNIKRLAKEILKEIDDLDSMEAYEAISNFLRSTLADCGDKEIEDRTEELLDRASKENAFETGLYEDMVDLIDSIR